MSKVGDFCHDPVTEPPVLYYSMLAEQMYSKYRTFINLMIKQEAKMP